MENKEKLIKLLVTIVTEVIKKEVPIIMRKELNRVLTENVQKNNIVEQSTKFKTQSGEFQKNNASKTANVNNRILEQIKKEMINTGEFENYLTDETAQNLEDNIVQKKQQTNAGFINEINNTLDPALRVNLNDSNVDKVNVVLSNINKNYSKVIKLAEQKTVARRGG